MSKFGCDMSRQLTVFDETSPMTFDDFARKMELPTGSHQIWL